ncbi:MAG: hypothetical protein MI784_04200 [Cytophagales bacterium]|nr:hypothetical protein [Cytophagales bacterium]
MDKYRITFTCHKKPNDNSRLKGFETNRTYIGRSYNGLFEISTCWGDGGPTVLLKASEFKKYFQTLTDNFSIERGTPVAQ